MILCEKCCSLQVVLHQGFSKPASKQYFNRLHAAVYHYGTPTLEPSIITSVAQVVATLRKEYKKMIGKLEEKTKNEDLNRKGKRNKKIQELVTVGNRY